MDQFSLDNFSVGQDVAVWSCMPHQATVANCGIVISRNLPFSDSVVYFPHLDRFEIAQDEDILPINGHEDDDLIKIEVDGVYGGPRQKVFGSYRWGDNHPSRFEVLHTLDPRPYFKFCPSLQIEINDKGVPVEDSVLSVRVPEGVPMVAAIGRVFVRETIRIAKPDEVVELDRIEYFSQTPMEVRSFYRSHLSNDSPEKGFWRSLRKQFWNLNRPGTHVRTQRKLACRTNEKPPIALTGQRSDFLKRGLMIKRDNQPVRPA